MGCVGESTPIGMSFEREGPIIVNGWSGISSCAYTNYVLYSIDDTNFLDLSDVDIRWFGQDTEVWRGRYD